MWVWGEPSGLDILVLHILGLAHTQNRADRCNYIDVKTDLITGWGEWRVGQLTGAADWFELR